MFYRRNMQFCQNRCNQCQYRYHPCQKQTEMPQKKTCCYNEEDYCVSGLENIYCQYCALQKEADMANIAALIKVREAGECIQKAKQYRAESEHYLCETKTWLNRYYERYGSYGNCDELNMQQEQLSTQLCCLGEQACECNCDLQHKLEESCCISKKLEELSCKIKEECFPKC